MKPILNLVEAKRIIKNLIKLKEQEEKGEISKDAETLSNHALLDKINTKDEWIDVMNALMDHGNTISQVSNSVKTTTLRALLKTIGKEDTPQNGAL
tara:strand:+ start:671 stop:958 length:288 start_codon:yes stop_codon:yes gene_type:complete